MKNSNVKSEDHQSNRFLYGISNDGILTEESKYKLP